MLLTLPISEFDIIGMFLIGNIAFSPLSVDIIWRAAALRCADTVDDDRGDLIVLDSTGTSGKDEDFRILLLG